MRWACGAIAMLSLAGCQREATPDRTPPTIATAAIAPDRPPDAEPVRKRPSVDMLRRHIVALSSDAMQGRRPGTEGGRLAVAYVAEQMQALGLIPAGTDGYRQVVPMRSITPRLDDAQFELTRGDQVIEALRPRADVVAGSLRSAGAHAVDAELVFAGYGITAPEYEWDDYAGIDVTDKLVVVLVGDPPVEDGRFGGSAMTYYGRWSYKFERALAGGAAGCLVVHDPDAASYGWNVVEASWGGERFALRSDGADALALQGWIHRLAAERLAAAAGTSLAAWHDAALAPGFAARALDVSLRASVTTTERAVTDSNVVGTIAGASRPDESIVITAHWDHLGTADDEQASADAIFNGAVDNASGVAGLLAVAAGLQARAAEGRGPARTVVLLATTAEEQGLLGSRHFAEHPTVDATGIVAAMNLDSMNVHGRTATITVVGAGQSTLEDVLAEVASAQGRRVVPDERPEAGGYYRSDHFSFARRGIPAIHFHGGLELQDGGVEAGDALQRERARRYHTVDDEYDESWPLTGALQDVDAMIELVVRVAEAPGRPSFKPASEFSR